MQGRKQREDSAVYGWEMVRRILWSMDGPERPLSSLPVGALLEARIAVRACDARTMEIVTESLPVVRIARAARRGRELMDRFRSGRAFMGATATASALAQDSRPNRRFCWPVCLC